MGRAYFVYPLCFVLLTYAYVQYQIFIYTYVQELIVSLDRSIVTPDLMRFHIRTI